MRAPALRRRRWATVVVLGRILRVPEHGHQERERFLGPRGTPDANGVAELITPQAGGYFVNLLVKSADPKRKGQTTLVATKAEPVAIGDAAVPDIEWQLDAATVQRLRELMQ